MFIENWFPTPIFYSYADKDIKEKIFNEFKLEEFNIISSFKKESWGDNVDSSFDNVKNIINKHNLNTLNNYILSMANIFAKQLFLDSNPKQIEESWVNYLNKYQYQEKHVHACGTWGISGVYYFQTNGEDGKLRIHPPRHDMINPNKKSTNYTHSTIEYAPEVGKIILFPSWVEHSVRPNMTDSTRISISFNIKV
jgi:uncharacterized protein (TIGR02466 family)